MRAESALVRSKKQEATQGPELESGGPTLGAQEPADTETTATSRS